VSLVCRLWILEFLHFHKCDFCILVDNHNNHTESAREAREGDCQPEGMGGWNQSSARLLQVELE
jgi:hypothetical protein